MTDEYIAIPLSPLRKVIASRMAEATRTIPHFRVGCDIELDAVLAATRELRDRVPDAAVSLNDWLIKASAAALMEVPAINIQWAETHIHQYRAADISVVIALDGGGLTTPILRSAESKSLLEISSEVRSLAVRARQSTLRMDEIFGGSFSISNLGMYGVAQFDAIINPPQCAILAVGAAKRGLVISREDEQRIATLLRVTLSVDHRALDGAIAAKFLTALRCKIEAPHELLAGTSDLRPHS